MANDSSGESWWGNFLKTAKEKSMTAMEVIKTDLAEFTSTMSNDTSNLINQASSHLNNPSSDESGLLKNLTKSISNNFSLNSFLNSTNEKSSNSESNTATSNSTSSKPAFNTSTSIHDRLKHELLLLQSNEKTFLTDPTGNEFEDWLANFNSDNYKSTISDLLIENSSMRLLYSQLVPAQISNNQFWSRYFYKVNQLEEEHKKRVKLIESLNENKSDNDVQEDDWDDDEKTTETENNENKLEPVLETVVENQVSETTQEKTESEKSENDLEVKELVKQPSEEIKEEKMVESKTEDSDEWEKVSDVLDNGTEKTQLVNQSQTETTEKIETQEADSNKNQEDLAKIRENVISKMEKIDQKASNIDAEWDEWDE